MLYVSFGDGGSGGDPQGHGQNVETLLGAILRIDVMRAPHGRAYAVPEDNPFVGRPGHREEIFAYGLRNPWRFAFDRLTGALWTGDVGQNRVEEIDIVEAGRNYGWNVMEGNRCFEPSSGCDTSGFVPPVHTYEHGSAGRSITGGFVYRGSGLAGLVGRYIFADFVSGNIWALDGAPSGGSRVAELLIAGGPSVSSFGEDADGRLYVCAFDGRIHQLEATGNE
jgi:glucose/arabinose dehydrogenase